MDEDVSIDDRAPWLLLIHQFPAKPAYQRVKIWRRLQGLGFAQRQARFTF